MSNRIANPVRNGSTLIIPKGTPIRSMNPRDDRMKHSGRDRAVKVHHTSDGWIDTLDYDGHGLGFVKLPTITWAGAAGYWQTVKVTPELLTLNGITVPEIPEQSEYEKSRFTVTPSYERGHCDRND